MFNVYPKITFFLQKLLMLFYSDMDLVEVLIFTNSWSNIDAS
jgi:hypothetical protein